LRDTASFAVGCKDLQTFDRSAPLGRWATAGRCPKSGIIALLLGSSKPTIVSPPWRCGNPLVFGTGQEGSEGGVADPSSPARFKDSIRQYSQSRRAVFPSRFY